MKLRTTAQLIHCTIDGEQLNFENPSSIELEYSAIDTGGGYKDPILDFSFEITSFEDLKIAEQTKHIITPTLRDPRRDNEITFSYEGLLKIIENSLLIVNGRLKEDQLNEQLVGFVMKRLQ